MELPDKLAARAMQSFLPTIADNLSDPTGFAKDALEENKMLELARKSYAMADAMIQVRDGKTPPARQSSSTKIHGPI